GVNRTRRGRRNGPGGRLLDCSAVGRTRATRAGDESHVGGPAGRARRLEAGGARVSRDARRGVARVAARARRRAGALRSARERDAPGTTAAGRAARLEWWQRMGVAARGSPGSGADGNPGAGGMIVVVLHEPQELVNIAHVVRALKNFGLRDLRLVDPREYDASRIAGIAHQTQDVLARVARFEGLPDALADCVHVVGFTARGRTAKRNLQRPREAAGEILGQADAGPTALLFGREDKGLPNEALDLCHRV